MPVPNGTNPMPPWNLQWYMNNPEYDPASGMTWMGSQGGIRLNRSATTTVTATTGFGAAGAFPESTDLNSGAGRYPHTLCQDIVDAGVSLS